MKQRLDRVGYVERSRLGIAATFIGRKEILRQKRETVADILSTYGIHDGQIQLDRMPLDFESLRNYPADLVIGIEIYRHGRPTEFNGTRRGPSLLSSGGMAASMAPMILIWTFIP